MMTRCPGSNTNLRFVGDYHSQMIRRTPEIDGGRFGGYADQVIHTHNKSTLDE